MPYLLVLGDVLAIAIVTLIGFATHGETSLAFLPRMAALLFPLVVCWFLLAPALGLFQRDLTTSPRQLWRPVWAGLFAGTLAVVLRGFLLNAPVLPLFAAIMAGVFALGMLIWRALYYALNRKAPDGR
jgi:hypothetical protein